MPAESNVGPRGESYDVSDADPSAARTDSYLAVVCPLCNTRMYAKTDQVGQVLTCPDCGTATEVTRPLPEEPPRPTSTPVAEEYPVYQGAGQPPPTDRAVYQLYIPVVCPLCNTRMLATAEQVGQVMDCPDCQTPCPVPPFARRVPLPGAPDGDPEGDAYAVQAGTRASSTSDPLILVTCDVCHTRLYGTADQRGQKIICPDCYSPVPVPFGPGTTTSRQRPQDQHDEYTVSAPVQQPPLVIPGFAPIVDDGPLRPTGQWDDDDAWEQAAERRRRAANRPPRTERPAVRVSFLGDLFDLPFRSSMRVSGLLLLLSALAMVALGHEAIQLAGSGNPLAQFLGAMFGVGFTILVFLSLSMAASQSLHIIRETGNGCDDVAPSDASFTDRILEVFYLLFAFALAVLFGMLIDAALKGLGLGSGLGIVVSLFLLFPIALLSMLENNTPLGLVSVPVLRSLKTAAAPWLGFYAKTLVIAAAIWFIVWGAFLLSTRVGVLVDAALTVWFILVYSRLMGRLAWQSAEIERRSREEEEEEGE